MKLFSISHLLELAPELPDPSTAEYPVLRLPIRDGHVVLDVDHPEREFEIHKDAFIEFEIINWKDSRGMSFPRWVLRGLVAM